MEPRALDEAFASVHLKSSGHLRSWIEGKPHPGALAPPADKGDDPRTMLARPLGVPVPQRGGAGRMVLALRPSYRVRMRPWRAPLLWATADVRRRWRSLVVLGVLAGITAGLAMAAFAGARRTDTALARLDKVTNAPDAIVFASQVHDWRPDWSRLAARPEVAQLAVWDLFFCNINGQAGGPLLPPTATGG